MYTERIREIQEIVALFSHCLQNALLLRLGMQQYNWKRVQAVLLSKRPCKKKDFGGESEAMLLGVISDELISLRENVEGMKTVRELLFLYLFCF